jgi:hypothetical protein
MKIRNRTINRLLARGAGLLLRVWFRLMRFTLVSEAPGIAPYEETPTEKYLYCLWHDGILGMIFSRRQRHLAGLVSLHNDGAYVADMMEIFGIRPIRGSSGRRGVGAVREMMVAARDWHIAIATDGPRGPRHVVKDGILYLASHSGRGIVPAAYAVRRGWRPRGRWTDMLIPRPCTRTWILAAAPIRIPPDLRPDQLEPYRQQLQLAMEQVHQLAEQIARGEAEGFTPGWRDTLPGVATTPAEPASAKAA